MSSTPTGSTGTEYLVGIVVRVHGLRGDLVVELHTDAPDERFAPGASLIAQRPDGPAGTLTVESVRRHSGRLLVRFAEAQGRDAAEALRGTQLLIPADAIAPSDDDEEFHVHQLEGLRAELEDGTVVGSVREVLHGPGGDTLVLARPERPDALVPFVLAIVPAVDLAAGRLVLTPPEGLLD